MHENLGVKIQRLRNLDSRRENRRGSERYIKRMVVFEALVFGMHEIVQNFLRRYFQIVQYNFNLRS